MDFEQLFVQSWEIVRQSKAVLWLGVITALFESLIGAGGIVACALLPILLPIALIARGGLVYAIYSLRQGKELSFKESWTGGKDAALELLGAWLDLVSIFLIISLLMTLFGGLLYVWKSFAGEPLVLTIAAVVGIALYVVERGVLIFTYCGAVIRAHGGVFTQNRIGQNLIRHGWEVFKGIFGIPLIVVLVFQSCVTIAAAIIYQPVGPIVYLLATTLESTMLALLYLDFMKFEDSK
jgi:hypothetical protein